MQPQCEEAERHQGAQRRRHQAVAGIGLTDPITDTAGLGDAAAHIRQRDAADQGAIRLAEDEKRIGLIGALVFGVALEAAAKCPAGEIIDGPDRFPGLEKGAAALAQRRPFGKVRHLRRTQHHPLVLDGGHDLGKCGGAEKRHGTATRYRRGLSGQSLRDRRRMFQARTVRAPRSPGVRGR